MPCKSQGAGSHAASLFGAYMRTSVHGLLSMLVEPAWLRGVYSTMNTELEMGRLCAVFHHILLAGFV